MNWLGVLLLFATFCLCYIKIEFDVDWGTTPLESAKKQIEVSHGKWLNETERSTGVRAVVYTTELELGSTHQRVKLRIDTSSPDMWVVSHDVECYKKPAEGRLSAQTMKQRASTCTAHGTYETGISEAYQQSEARKRVIYQDGVLVFHDTLFSLILPDGNEISGEWAYDSIRVGGAYTIEEQLFAVATVSTLPIGTLGLGVRWTGWNGHASTFYYHHFIFLLVNDFHIAKAVYSIYLDTYDARRGIILFGALDHAKYLGLLTTLHMVQIPYRYVELDDESAGQVDDAEDGYIGYVIEQNYGPNEEEDEEEDGYFEEDDDGGTFSKRQFLDEDVHEGLDGILSDEQLSAYVVKMHGLCIQAGPEEEKRLSSRSYVAYLDYNAPSTIFPRKLFNKTIEALGGATEVSGIFLVDCKYRDVASVLKVTFGPTEITVPLSQFVGEITPGKCGLSIIPSDLIRTYIILGNDILRYMYVVVDLEDLDISIAQIRHTPDTEIEEINQAIPNAKKIYD